MPLSTPSIGRLDGGQTGIARTPGAGMPVAMQVSMLLILLACSQPFSETTTTDGAANLQVLPEVFDLGLVTPGCEVAELPWSITNVGDSPVSLDNVLLAGASWEVTVEVPITPVTHQPGASFTGTISYAPMVEGEPGGALELYSDDPGAPLITRDLFGEGCCEDSGDALLLSFDELAVGTWLAEQYASEGVQFIGSGDPGEGFDTTVITDGADCTTAALSSGPNLLCAHVNDGFNHSGDPGLAGIINVPAESVSVRMYNAGLSSGADDSDQATLVVYDIDGIELGSHTDTASTSLGEEWVTLRVDTPGVSSFAVFTGDFEAVDDVQIQWAAEDCE